MLLVPTFDFEFIVCGLRSAQNLIVSRASQTKTIVLLLIKESNESQMVRLD